MMTDVGKVVRVRRWSVGIVVAAVLLTGCGNDEPPPPLDDGAQGVPLAGQAPALDRAGVEVVAASTPAAADGAAVVTALGDAGVDDAGGARAADVPDGELALSPEAVAGLVSVVRAGARRVVLVFADPSGAAVFAAADRDVLPASARATDPTVLLAGNLVAYAARTADAPALREALASLAGAPSPSASPSDSPSDSPSASPSASPS